MEAIRHELADVRKAQRRAEQERDDAQRCVREAREVTRELERLPAGAARERLLARVMPIVDGWPDAMRVATYEAKRRLEAGELPGVCPLIRSHRRSGKR